MACRCGRCRLKRHSSAIGSPESGNVTNPTHDQIVAGAASGTLSDVVGLDGAWVNGLAKQDAIAPIAKRFTFSASSFTVSQCGRRLI